jgi:hypothetical protein
MLKIVTDYQAKAISNGDRTNPIVMVCDRLRIEPVVQRYYLHNDDITVFYTGVTLQARVDQLPEDWNLQILVQEAAPTAAQWAALANNNLAEIGVIGSLVAADVNYHPFWIRLIVPEGTALQSLAAQILRLTYAEYQR